MSNDSNNCQDRIPLEWKYTVKDNRKVMFEMRDDDIDWEIFQ